MLENFLIGENETKIALACFNNEEKEIVNFKNFKNFSNIKNEILNLNYSSFSSFGTNTARALEYANLRLFKEDLGMRAEEFGIPKTIIVVTDGDSDDKIETIKNANILKRRGFNLITVGIGNLFTDEKELLAIASSRNDAFKIDEFDRLPLYLSTLARSANQKQALIPQEKEVNSFVAEKSYKYLKHQIEKSNQRETQNKTFITIRLEYNGTVELFYDFVDPNPKSSDEFLNQFEIATGDNDTNFIELATTKRTAVLKQDYNTKLSQNLNIKYYTIEIPVKPSSEFLSISIKGFDQINEFKVTVFDRLIDGVNTTDSSTTLIRTTLTTTSTKPSNGTSTGSSQETTLTSTRRLTVSGETSSTDEPTKPTVTSSSSIFSTTSSYIYDLLTSKKSSSSSLTSSFYLIVNVLLYHLYLKK